MRYAGGRYRRAHPICPETHLGPYEIVAPLGAGGMGAVYRARDSRLGRDVAIKVLPDVFVADPQRRARAEREARALASLNHPNIATLYGIEDTSAGPVLVMELVEGITLADRLALSGHGAKELLISEAVSIALQVASAIEAAHDQGIIHRDLKPANIALRTDGAVKVLDFGLASPITGNNEGASANTPTVTTDDRWQRAGTPAYMSPEQVRGVAVDERTDIWAFGCVLFEMLARRRPFEGETIPDVLASVVERSPDWTALPQDTPPLLRRLLQRCLEKDPKRRLRHIGDARADLEDPFFAATDAHVQPRGWPRTAVALAIVLSLALALASLWAWRRPRTVTASPPVHLSTMLPAGVSVARGPALGSAVALSPDGRTLVVAGSDRDGRRLYVRPLDRLEATPLANTERGSSPFFSADGKWIGFLADGRLKRIPAAGGATVDIVAVPGTFAGASWGADDRVVFAYVGEGEMRSVSASGGPVEPVVADTAAYYPHVVADGRTLLYVSDGWIHLLDRATGRRTRLLQGTAPWYAAGHVVLGRGATLLAVPIDLARHELTGPVVPLVEGVASDASPGGGMRHYAIAGNGTLAYVAAPAAYNLVVVNRDGTERVLGSAERSIENPQFSPDGRLIVAAITRAAATASDLWIHDRQAGTATQLTFDGARAPIWMPDGRTVVYSHVSERAGIYAKTIDGRTEARQLVPLSAFHWLIGRTPDSRTITYGVMEGTRSSLMALTDGHTRRIVGPAQAWGGRLSADGRWLAYYSLDSGRLEVYVTPFPEGGSRWLIAEGTDPKWSPDGNEVYYRSGTRLMAARVERASGFRVTSQRTVVDPFLPPLFDDYDIHTDGRTLVLVRPLGATLPREVTVAVNFLDTLRSVVPRK